MSIESGVLYVVATPIGNRADLSPRARDVLSAVDEVLAEDTRRTRPLLRDFGIATPISALHEHNERERVPELLERLAGGASLALVSDAGTPLVSDPGFPLVRAAREAGHRVSPIPGPCAAIAALSAAGIPAERFSFEGFLPSKPAARRKALAAVGRQTRTLVYYESVHRIRATLADMAEEFGSDRTACVARELTKVHETIRVAPLRELAEWAAVDDDVTRGEIVIIVAGADDDRAAPASAVDPFVLAKLLSEELPAGKAASLAARITGHPRSELYRYLTTAT